MKQLSEKSILVTVDEQEPFTEHAAKLQNHPRMRERVYQDMLEKLKGVKGAYGKLKGQKEWQKKKRGGEG